MLQKPKSVRKLISTTYNVLSIGATRWLQVFCIAICLQPWTRLKEYDSNTSDSVKNYFSHLSIVGNCATLMNQNILGFLKNEKQRNISSFTFREGQDVAKY